MRWRGATALAAVSGVVLLGVLGVVVLALLLVDRVTVRTAGDLGSVPLGLPFAWVHQEQGVDPPLPWRAGLLSPWEHPTTLSVLPTSSWSAPSWSLRGGWGVEGCGGFRSGSGPRSRPTGRRRDADAPAR